jgi:prepilin-type processing-associated H-X9-DG protein
MPYGPYKLTTSCKGGAPVAADRNPWMDGPRWKANNFADFQPNGSAEQQRAGNTPAHWLDGQNVLFLDSHVEFMKRSFCGLDNDNIYTISGNKTGGDRLGTPPTLGSQPANPKDSLLVNDPPAPRE